MEVYVKRFADYRTIKKATSLSHAIVLDSLEYETSTVTVKGTHINRSNVGDWISVKGLIFNILKVKPQGDRTLLTLISPLDAFDRSLFPDPFPDKWIGGEIEKTLNYNWVKCSDSAYAVPYLQIINEDATPFVAPETDKSGLWQLPAYVRLMRKIARVTVTFQDTGKFLLCRIRKAPVLRRQISFSDGHSQLQQVDYSVAGLTKVTVFRNIESTNASGSAVLLHEESTWYLSEDGVISNEVPPRRARGRWKVIEAKGKEPMVESARSAFAKNKSSHKIEFFSDKELTVGDVCRFNVYDDILTSDISYKRITSEDSRIYYKSGELATTASDRLKGVKNER